MPNATSRSNVSASKMPTYGVVMSGLDTVTNSGAGVDFNSSGNVGFDLTVSPTTTPAQLMYGALPASIAYTPGSAATTIASVTVPNVTGIWGVEITTIFQDGASDGARASTSQVWIQRVAGAAAVGGVSGAGSFNITVGACDAGTITWSVGTVTGGVTAANVVPIQVAYALGNAVAGNIKNTFWKLLLSSNDAVSVA